MSKVVKTITINQEVWDYLQKTKNASGFINDIIMKQIQENPSNQNFTPAISPIKDYQTINKEIYENIKRSLTREQYNSISKSQAIDYQAMNAGTLSEHVLTRFKNQTKWELCLAYWRRQAKDLYSVDV